jgi:hypothetical protein
LEVSPPNFKWVRGFLIRGPGSGFATGQQVRHIRLKPALTLQLAGEVEPPLHLKFAGTACKQQILYPRSLEESPRFPDLFRELTVLMYIVGYEWVRCMKIKKAKRQMLLAAS